MCDNNLWINMIFPPVKNAKRKEIYYVQFIKQGCISDSHLSSEDFSAICHFNLMLHTDSNTCFNHSAIQNNFQWHSSHYDISDISILDDASTSNVLPYTCAWHRWKPYSQNTFWQNFCPLSLKHLTDIFVSARKLVVYVLGIHFSFSLMTYWNNLIFCNRFLS